MAVKQKHLDKMSTQLAEQVLDFSKPNWQTGMEDPEHQVKSYFSTNKALLSLCCKDKLCTIDPKLEWADDEGALRQKISLVASLSEDKDELEKKLETADRQTKKLETEIALAKGKETSTSALEAEREKFQVESAKASSSAAASKRELARVKRDLAKVKTELTSTQVNPNLTYTISYYDNLLGPSGFIGHPGTRPESPIEHH